METLQKYAPWLAAVAVVGSLRWLYLSLLRYRSPFARYSFKDKVCVITGGSQGVGRALAIDMHKRGAHVVLLARSIDKLRELCDELRSMNPESHNQPQCMYLDMADESDSLMDVERLLDLCGSARRIDILVNNAGVAVHSSAAATTMAVHRNSMQINYFGQVQLTQALLPHITPGGCIVVVTSVQARFAIPFRTAYAASKHAVQAYFDSLRAELLGRVQVLCVQPGYIKTNLGRNALTGSGRVLEHDDPHVSTGMPPEYVAARMCSAIAAGDHELFLAPIAPRGAHWLRFLLPNLYFAVMGHRALKHSTEQH